MYVLEAEDPAHRDHHRQHHREAREDGAGHEVGREDRRVPAGHDRHGEVPGHDAVHREHQRRGEAREVQHRPAVRLPLPRGALPAEREHRVERAAPAGRAVARDREVGDQADVEEHDRGRRVGGDREDVPQQRALEVHPQRALVRVRQDEVGLPDAADVDAEELRGGEHREDRHRLGAAVDRVAPLRAEQIEDRRDQRARVRDADPEHEGDDVRAPEDRVRVAGDAEALVDLVDPDAAGREHEADAPGASSGPVAERRALHDAQQVAVDLRVARHGRGADHRGDGFGGRRRHAVLTRSGPRPRAGRAPDR